MSLFGWIMVAVGAFGFGYGVGVRMSSRAYRRALTGAVLEACRATREILGGHPEGPCGIDGCAKCRDWYEHIGRMFGVVYRDPTQWRDWHAVDDLTDRATEIVVVGTKTRETQHTLFLTQEVGSDGELRSTVGVPKVCIVHKRRLTEGENDD